MNGFVGMFIAAEGGRIDQTHHWLWPEGYELLFGGLASIIIFSLLWWKLLPFARNGLQARTDRVQQEIDSAAEAKASAEAEALQISQAKGDIGAERARLLAEADEQAEALIADGRVRLDREIAELHTKADADIAAALGRGTDELRAEIARLSSAAADRVVEGTLDDATQQRLIEDYIQRVGAGASA